MLTISKFHIRERKEKNSFEARINLDGKPISISAKTRAILHDKLKEFCKNYNQKLKQNGDESIGETIQTSDPSTTSTMQMYMPLQANMQNFTPIQLDMQAYTPARADLPTFETYARKYIKIVKEDDISDDWLKKQIRKLEIYVFPFIGDKKFSQISIFDLQEILKAIRKAGYERTAEDVHNLLDQICEYAVYDELMPRNPMKRVKFFRHDRQKTLPLTFEEERALLEYSATTIYYRAVVLMLYAGLRLCECKTAVLTDDKRFIIAENSKRKNHKKEWKRIPVTPMMKPYLDLISSKPKHTDKAVISWFCNHEEWKFSSRSLRHTFNTRLAMFKIEPELRMLAMGHKSGTVNIDIYTHYEMVEDVYYNEFQRVDYHKELYPDMSPTQNE